MIVLVVAFLTSLLILDQTSINVRSLPILVATRPQLASIAPSSGLLLTIRQTTCKSQPKIFRPNSYSEVNNMIGFELEAIEVRELEPSAVLVPGRSTDMFAKRNVSPDALVSVLL